MSDDKPKKQTRKKVTPTATMEVPRTVHITIDNGILMNKDKLNSVENLLFFHCMQSANGRNDAELVSGLLKAHGVQVEIDNE